jgi:DNA-binding CsgD family transcriptional regulator
VLALLEEGASRVEIGRALRLEPSDVSALLASIQAKAGLTGRLDLVDSGLSDAQQKVVRLLAEGHTNPTIARRLYLSPAGVRARLRSVYEVLGVCNRFEALARLAHIRD